MNQPESFVNIRHQIDWRCYLQAPSMRVLECGSLPSLTPLSLRDVLLSGGLTSQTVPPKARVYGWSEHLTGRWLRQAAAP
jgi:hypothetical protein